MEEIHGATNAGDAERSSSAQMSAARAVLIHNGSFLGTTSDDEYSACGSMARAACQSNRQACCLPVEWIGLIKC
jgi:hypothetical protein